MVRKSKEDEIIVLLQDYNNYLPSGAGEAYVPTPDKGASFSSNWPLNAEAEKRMDKDTLVGETYEKLDVALSELAREFPKLYRAIDAVYLEDGVGHNQLGYYRQLARNGGLYKESAEKLVDLHDRAIQVLAAKLDNESLYVRWPMLHVEFDSRKKAESANDEIFAIYKRYVERGSSHDHAIANIQALLDDDVSKEYIERVIDARLD